MKIRMPFCKPKHKVIQAGDKWYPLVKRKFFGGYEGIARLPYSGMYMTYAEISNVRAKCAYETEEAAHNALLEYLIAEKTPTPEQVLYKELK